MSSSDTKTPIQELPDVTVLFAGDSGDGMQLAGSQFTLAAAYAQNDLATLPDYPAEIRAPSGTTYGVSGFQIHFGSSEIRTPGDHVDLLIAMNPAALKVHLPRLRKGGSVLINSDTFNDRGLKLAEYEENPLEDGTLDGYKVLDVALTTLNRKALEDSDLGLKEIDRSKNMFALGLVLWLYDRPLEPALSWLDQKFKDKPAVREANKQVLKKGAHYGETTEQFAVKYRVEPAALNKGTYRAIRGAEALALGLVAAGDQSGLDVFYASYPITPASDILHEMSKHKNFGVMTFQAEDEIAAASAALGAGFGGNLGVTATSGPGMALKTETIGLGVMTELPLVIINMQRGGPSTGLPTKTEQGDLMQALYGRNGESPLPVIAPASPADCFAAAYEASRIATKYMTPVILLADEYLSSGSEPWRIPDVAELPAFEVRFATKPNSGSNGEATFLPYLRDESTGARPWARPGTADMEHRIGGLEKEHESGDVSYAPQNHEKMVKLRAAKVEKVQQEIPPTEILGEDEGELLVVGWGSTRGAITEAVQRTQAEGRAVSSIHLKYLNPLPPDLSKILDRFEEVLIPELNQGQLATIFRDTFTVPVIQFNKMQGRPFSAAELEQKILELTPTA